MPKKYLLFLFLILLVGLWIAQGIYLPLVNEAEPQKFRVRKGQGATKISEGLRNKRIIKSGLWFNLYYFLKGETLKAGTYSVSKAMSVAEIFDKMAEGKTIPDKVTIVEGWSIRDIGEKLEDKGWYQAEQFYEVVGYPVSRKGSFSLASSLEEEYDFLKSKPRRRKLEGYLFPDTYYLNGQAAPEDLAKKMLDNFGEKINGLKLDGERSLFEIITMASLVEKEVKTLKDKKIVAGILWKRLENGIPLQVDATISYVIGGNTVEISKQETEIGSPYNTYKYRGLPAGPICNPGLESIKAVLNPTATDYWYYLSVPQEKDCPQCSAGGTYFSESLRQHNIAKSRYLSD